MFALRNYTAHAQQLILLLLPVILILVIYADRAWNSAFGGGGVNAGGPRNMVDSDVVAEQAKADAAQKGQYALVVRRLRKIYSG